MEPASRATENSTWGRSRGGLTSKIHGVVDANGLPVQLGLRAANIPPKPNRKEPICFCPYLYRGRNVVERFFNKIKQCRRIATCYDKPAFAGTTTVSVAIMVTS
jgi:transposase